MLLYFTSLYVLTPTNMLQHLTDVYEENKIKQQQKNERKRVYMYLNKKI